MPVRRPRKPSAPRPAGGRRRASAALPSDVIQQSGRFAEGVGSRFMEASTREPDLGHGLPKAPKPVVAVTPAEIRKRTAQKLEANRRKGVANNVRGYAAPIITGEDPRQLGGRLPTAEELFQLTEGGTRPLDRLPSAEELLELSQGEEDSSSTEGSYLFPQISPTKTINPPRPRTLEAGWERIRDEDDPRFPGVLRVRFRDGTPWEYYKVPSEVWQRFKRVQSPGRFINRILNQYPYARGEF